MTKAEFFICMDARKPILDELIARKGMLEARRIVFANLYTLPPEIMAIGIPETAEWWDKTYSQLN